MRIEEEGKSQQRVKSEQAAKARRDVHWRVCKPRAEAEAEERNLQRRVEEICESQSYWVDSMTPEARIERWKITVVDGKTYVGNFFDSGGK